MELHLIHDDEVVKMGGKPGHLIAAGLKEKVVGKAVNYCIAKDSALSVKQEAVVPVILLKRLHGVGHHAIEPAHAVVALYPQKAEITEVVNAGRFSQRPE